MNLTKVFFLTYIPITKSYAWLDYRENAWKKSTNSRINSEFCFLSSKRKRAKNSFPISYITENQNHDFLSFSEQPNKEKDDYILRT